MNLIGRALLAGFSVAVAAGSLFRSRPRAPRRRGSPTLVDDALVTADGLRLPLQVWRPAGEPSAVIVALHGFGDWRGSFEVSAPLFAARNVLLYAYDQRGFGETKTRGAWPGVDALLDDLRDAAAACAARHPGLPLVILGENMGASLALLASEQAEPPLADALLLAAPGLADDHEHDVGLRLAGLSLPWLTAELRRGAHPWLLPDEARRFAQDPKIVRELDAQAHDGLVELARRASAVGRAALPPTLVLHGALDTAVPEETVGRLVARLEPRAALLSYPNRHHLLLHEEDVDRVVDDCVRWLEPLLPAARARRRVVETRPGAGPSDQPAPPKPAGVAGEPQEQPVVKAAE